MRKSEIVTLGAVGIVVAYLVFIGIMAIRGVEPGDDGKVEPLSVAERELDFDVEGGIWEFVDSDVIMRDESTEELARMTAEGGLIINPEYSCEEVLVEIFRAYGVSTMEWVDEPAETKAQEQNTP